MTGVMEIKLGLEIARRLFSHNGGNPHLAISAANRELILELHTRLDLIEEGLAEILTRITEIPRQVYETSLQAQQYALGQEILAIGENFFSARIRMLEIEQSTSYSSDAVKFELDEYERYLGKWLYDINMTTANLNSRSGSLSVGALSNVVATYVKLGILIEQKIRFGRSHQILVSHAKDAIDRFKAILQENSRTGSLGYIIAQTEKAIKEHYDTIGWRKTLDLSDKNFFEGGIQTEIFGQLEFYETHPPFDPWDPYGEFTRMVTDVRLDYAFVMKLTAQLSDNGVYDFDISAEDISHSVDLMRVVIDEYVYHGSVPRDFVGTLHHARDRRQLDAQLRGWLSKFQRNYWLWQDLIAIKSTVEQAISGVNEVIRGDYSSIFSDGIFSVDHLEMADLNARLLQASELDALDDLSAYRAALESGRVRLSRLVLTHDRHITEQFRLALSSVRTNRMLGLLEIGMALLQMYERSEIRTRNSNDLIEKMREISREIDEDADREPASAAVGHALDLAASQLAWWGNMLNARRQGEAMAVAVRQIESAIPEGEEREYIVIGKGNQFYLLVPADTPSIYDGNNTRPIGRIVITGKKKQS